MATPNYTSSMNVQALQPPLQLPPVFSFTRSRASRAIIRRHASLSIAQAAAMEFVNRRLWAVWLLPPLTLLIGPAFFISCIFVTDLVTFDNGMIGVLLACLLIVTGRRLIWIYAPTVHHREDALYDTFFRLRLLSWAVSIAICRYIIHPLFSTLNWFHNKAPFPVVAWSVFVGLAWKLAVAMTLIGLIVLMRFVGPISIIRCSSTPLSTNPYLVNLATLKLNFTNADAFLEFVAGPTDPTVESDRREHARKARFQKAPLWRCACHFLISLFAGWIMMSFFGIPQLSISMATLALTSSFVLLDGKSHELTPGRGQQFSTFFQSPWHEIAKLTTFTKIILSWVLSVAMTLVATYPAVKLRDLPWVIVASLAIATYSVCIDVVFRWSLAVVGVNLDRLERSIVGEHEPSVFSEDILITSILQGEPELIKFVVPQQAQPRLLDVEEEEIRRNDHCIEFMGRSLQNPQENQFLEDDALRLALLESLGGSGGRENGRPESPFGLPRHQDAIMRRLRASEQWGAIHTAQTVPIVIPVIRALCAYSGGLGEALLLVCNDPRRQSKSTKPAILVSWLLPPCAIACAEYSIMAAARFVALNLIPPSDSSAIMVDKRHSHVSLMMPSVLHSAFRLRCGILAYADYVSRKHLDASGSADVSAGTLCKYIALHLPELMPALRACDEAAVLILGSGVDVSVQSSCKLWLKDLNSKKIDY